MVKEPIKQRGESSIALGPKTYRLKTSFAAFVRIEESLSIGILGLLTRWRQSDVRHKDIATVVYHMAIEGAEFGTNIDYDDIGTGLMVGGNEEFLKRVIEVMKILNVALSSGSKEAGAVNPN